MNTQGEANAWYVAWSYCWRDQTLKFGVTQLRIVGDPSSEAWERVKRYASWMRQVRINERSNAVEETFCKLRLGSPAGGWFPALQDLSWRITGSELPHTDLFFSPHLKRIYVYTPWWWGSSDVSCSILAAIASTISALPASTLQFLSVDVSSCDAPPAYFKDSLSSVILRCGPSLMELTSMVPLSDAAVNHLIQLPHLQIWHIQGPPPTYSNSSLPLTSPPLVKVVLRGATRGWLSLFQRLEDNVSTRGVTPLSKAKNSLKTLDVEDTSGLIIDVSFISPIQNLRNLVHFCVWSHEEDDPCTFKLNDDDVAKLAMALPQLETLLLGNPCIENTCATTVTCLLQISVHCLKLKNLEIHFNTVDIVGDLKNISENPRFQQLRSSPRCTLSHLYVGGIPHVLDEAGVETVANGMIDIFPSIECCGGQHWDDISGRIAKIREM